MNTTTPETAYSETVVPIVGEFIGVKPGFCGGKPHILGHSIKVQHFAVWHERMGMAPQEIVVNYPSLSLAAVFAALAYNNMSMFRSLFILCKELWRVSSAKVKTFTLA